MEKTLFGWFLTDHAKSTMAERGVSAPEIAEAILHPIRTETIDNGGIHWTHAAGVAWVNGRDPQSGTPARFIATILLSGPNQATWADEAPYLIIDTVASTSVVEYLSAVTRKTRTPKPNAKKAPARRGGTRRAGPVVTTSRFDGIPERTMESVREQLEALGRDPKDLSVVRRDGGKLIIEL